MLVQPPSPLPFTDEKLHAQLFADLQRAFKAAQDLSETTRCQTNAENFTVRAAAMQSMAQIAQALCALNDRAPKGPRSLG